MQTPVVVRPLTADERATLKTGSGPRPPVPCAAARCSSPMLRGSPPRPWPATCTAPIRPCATPFMPFTNAAALGCRRHRRDRTPCRPSSLLGPASPCGHACTSVRGRSASPRVGGHARWPPRSVLPRGSRRDWSATPRFGWPSAGGGGLEAGQAVAHQSRSGRSPKQNGATA
jgi:hypothetical protein